MNYFSLNQKSEPVSFKDAVINGLAPDRGLYFPENITPLSRRTLLKILSDVFKRRNCLRSN